MASNKLLQLKSKACEASRFVSKHGTTYYKQLLEENKQHIQEPATLDFLMVSLLLWLTCLCGFVASVDVLSRSGRELITWKACGRIVRIWRLKRLVLQHFLDWTGEIVGRGFTFTGYYPWTNKQTMPLLTTIEGWNWRFYYLWISWLIF